ncbi:serine threonine-protein kinase nak1 [Cladorrhinum samala]|uniref:non-specific serine/threonine protein kinase n=1 Tax=Cladorrhinum samala TaxID=585594 RepID=A0AAV9HZL6_9PEZI|nr:serine threonine-protein kinase nak1 [Cladorrhinum samala]
MDMRSAVGKECAESGITPPPFTLLELIGKGSFGRVYKAASQTTGSLVAVKIINIEEGDRAAPGVSDTFAEILREVSTVKLLRASGAKNINFIIDALLIGHSMWMVTQYCGGGSVATLMRPTGFLNEVWIVPILREVAEAVFWVHKQGIIHRDIKCANVLVAEDGGVQLCDFGVAGMVKSRFDKRKTVTGTLQWMAPELFDTDVSYGNEIDIWAFGSMAYEVATGLPPNAFMSDIFDMDPEQFGDYLRESSPKLEGDQYSSHLKDLIAYCMVPDPAERPRIEHVQRHPYIFDTEQERPTGSLSQLVAAFKKWEAEGGDRKSLFSPGGAQGLIPDSSHSVLDDEWDYGTIDEALPRPGEIPMRAELDLPQEQPKPRWRHGKPLRIRVSKPPLEKAFDPYTTSNYHANAQKFYGAPFLDRRGSAEDDNGATLRESPVRPSPRSANSDRPKLTPASEADTLRPACPSRNPSSEKTVTFNTTKTQDWKFPVMTPGTVTVTSPGGPPQSVIPTRTRAGTLHSRRTSSLSNRLSIISLIDLDESLEALFPAPPPAEQSPSFSSSPFSPCSSTSNSFPSTSSSSATPAAGMDNPTIPRVVIEGGGGGGGGGGTGHHHWDGAGGSGRKTTRTRSERRRRRMEMMMTGLPNTGSATEPEFPAPPAEDVISGYGGREGLRDELERLIGGMWEHLEWAEEVVAGLEVTGTGRED